MSHCRQLGLLLWKNFTLQKRKKVVTVIQLCLPLLLSFILISVRQAVDNKHINYSTTWPTFPIKEIPENLNPKVRYGNELPWKLYYTPNNPETKSIMKNVLQQFGPETVSDAIPSENEAEMVDQLIHCLEFEHSNGSFDCQALGGITFVEIPQSINGSITGTFKYKIRLSSAPRNPGTEEFLNPFKDDTRWNTEFSFPLLPSVGPREPNDTYGGQPGYYREGFLALQYNIDLAYIRLLQSGVTADGVSLGRTPYPPYIDDKFVLAIQQQLPSIVMLSFIFSVLYIVKDIVHEKERKLKETMKLMGLSGWLHWLAWYIKSFLMLLISAIIISTLLCISVSSHGAVISYSSPTLLAVFLIVYSHTTICFCFAISVFFSKANSAAAAGGVIFFLASSPYTILQLRYQDLSLLTKLATSLDLNVAMSFGCRLIGAFEGTGAGIQWSTVHSPPTVDDTLTMLHILLMLLLDSVICLLVTWYIEAVFPGEYGVPQPFYFPITRSYWCGVPLKSQDVSDDDTAHLLSSTNFEKDPSDLQPGIVMNNLRKEFGRGAATKVAVDDVNLTMYEGQISVLLGHNGAGKSTTISMLTGFFPPTRGTAEVSGCDIRRDIAGVRRSLGLCPQHNTLFDALTVEEHLTFFTKLKGVASERVEREVSEMMRELGLEDKRDAQSCTLSGGMKRKLCLGIALVGGSKVVILDEPTSGMDPSARRSAWDLLQRHRAGRTMVLTTHFMDEADVLGDRIAIMANGSIQCCGTPLFLKQKYGAGYHLVLVRNSHCDINKLTELITSHVEQAELESTVAHEVTYLLPAHSKPQFEALFTELEARHEELGVNSYGASVTTMEEVFLRVSAEADETMKSTESTPNNSDFSLMLDLDKNSGLLSYMQQFRALLVKRMLHTLRNWVVSSAQLLLPLIFTVIGLAVIRSLPHPQDSPPLALNLSYFSHNIIAFNSTDGPSALADFYRDQFYGTKSKTVHVKNFNESGLIGYLEKMGDDNPADYSLHYLIAATLASDHTPVNHTTGYFNDQAFHTPAITLNALDNALLKYYTGYNVSISTTNHPLPRTINDKASDAVTRNFEGFTVAFHVMFGMAFLVSSFTLFLVRERAVGAAHCQIVSGARLSVFWLTTYLWDLVNFLVPCLLLFVVFWGFDIEAYIGGHRMGDVLLLMLLYGLATLPLMYLLSRLFTVPASSFVWLTMLNIIAGTVTILAVNILNIPMLGTESVARVLEWVFIVSTPSFCLGQGLSNFYYNYQFLNICEPFRQLCELPVDMPCCQKTCTKNCLYYNDNYLSWELGGIGRMLVFLAIQTVVYWLLNIIAESRLMPSLDKCRQTTIRPMVGRSTLVEEDNDIADERSRVSRGGAFTDTLVLEEVSKSYSGARLAVNGISVGIPSGQCFGLLGVNGAGKTTTFKILTGEVDASGGDAFIQGHSVRDNLHKAYQCLGYCPQMDAHIDQLTGAESLTLYARLRSVKEHIIPSLVDNVLKVLLLERYADQQVGTYSGGNKRKLSAAVALIGGPAVVLLDEPSTGMDPVARHHLWRVLSGVRASGRTLLLTSHSMEECEALCTRVAIMVNGEFRCLGGPQHLKNKFGSGYTLIAKVHEDADVARLMQHITEKFPGSILKDQHQGMVHYHITDPAVTWAQLFGEMERVKDEYHVDDYSISQTTLEQIFINFARAQIPPAETNPGCVSWCGSVCRLCMCCHGNQPERLINSEESV